MERFLRYSLENGKKIRAVMLDGAVMKQENIVVTALDGENVTFTSAKAKKGRVLPLTAFLSAGYARGDSGEM